MSLFTEIEKTIERGFRKWTGQIFGPAETGDLLLVHRAILEQVESRVQTVQRGLRIFPYSLVTVRLASPDAGQRAVYEAAFARERRLENGIREVLTGTGCELPARFSVAVEAREEGVQPFEIEYSIEPAAEPPAAAAPAAPAAQGTPTAQATAAGPTGTATPQPSFARLVTLKGKTREDSYTLKRPRHNVGRLEELTDADRRVIRRNDVIFEEGGDDANSTVSRAHAHIRFDARTGEYRIADEGSEYGTRIFRDGRSIEVPAGNRRGERLHDGDEVYLGRACMRFEREAQ